MIYINFTDAYNQNIIDNLGRDFLVRENGVKISRNLSVEEIQELITSHSIKYAFYLYALYDDETVRKDLTPYLFEDGRLSINYSSGIRRRLSISLSADFSWQPSPTNNLFWKGAKFKLEIGIKTSPVEYICPAGVFILENFEIPHEHSNDKINLEMVDKFGGLDGTVGGKIVDNIYIPRGSNIINIVKGLLKSEKMPGLYYDVLTPLFPAWAYKATTPHTITENSNSTIGSLIIKLLSFINLDVFYDEYGRMCVEDMRENVIVSSMPSLWTFSDKEDEYNYHSMKTDFQAVENIVVIEGANINGDIVNAVVKNTNPKSPTNITVFEPTVCKIVDENIYSVSGAQIRGEYELFKRSLMPISINFSTYLIPILGVNNVVTIDDSYCGIKNSKFLINSIDISISGTSQMDMSISNLEEVAFDGK